MSDNDVCTWPGCNEPGLCQSGNFGNQIVCSHHFTRTNGETGEEVIARIVKELPPKLMLVRLPGSQTEVEVLRWSDLREVLDFPSYGG